MKLEIRDYKIEDVEEVYNILSQNFIHPWDKKSLTLVSNNFIKKVLVLDGEIIGFLEMQVVADEADLVMIAIKKEFQRKGLGEYFLKQIIKYLKERGITRIFLEVSSKNEKAINFYRKLGFVDYSIRKNYYKDGSDALLLELYLDSGD